MLPVGSNILLALALGGVSVSGEIVIVEDTTGEPHDPVAHPASVDLAIDAFAARGLYTVMGDDYDAVVTFTTHPMMGIQWVLTGPTPSGYQVRQNAQGVAYQNGWLIRQPPSAYNSPARLKHAVYMGPVRQWNADPNASYDVPAGPLGGTRPSGVTGIEVLGHEFGHHWLMFAAHDANDGRGQQALFRLDDRDPEQMDRPKPAAAGVHYSHYADSHSVMYGNFITAIGGGMFKLEGGDRKYGMLDQYLMGFRGPEEVPPMLAIDDGSQRGINGTPLQKGESQIVSGTGVMIPIADVIRAMGPRVPAYPNTQRCYRMAFVLVTHPGHTATPSEIALVDAYRRRWETWFPWATDGRGQTDTRLAPADPCPNPPVVVEPPGEGGVASQPLPPSAVATEVPTPVNPMPMPMEPKPEEPDTYRLKPGCACGSVEGSAFVLAFGVLLLRSRRRR